MSVHSRDRSSPLDAGTRTGVDVRNASTSSGFFDLGDGGRPWLVPLTLLGGSFAAAFVVAPLVNLLFLPAAVAVAAYCLWRGWRLAYLELTLWLWIVAPGIRRVVDSSAGFHPQSLVLATPAVVSLIAIIHIWHSRERVHGAVAQAFGITALAFGYALVFGAFNNGPTAAIVALLNLGAPVIVGAYVLLSGLPTAALERSVMRVTYVGLALLSGYGLYQFFFLPAWDADWMRSVKPALASIGVEEPTELRIFSLSNAPGPLAGLLVWMLISLIGASRQRLQPLVVVAGYIALALTLVRTSWLAWLVSIGFLALSGRIRVVRGILLAGGLVIGLTYFGGPIHENIESRIEQTTTDKTQDDSFATRIRYYETILPVIVLDPVGEGMGSTGSAARQSSFYGTFANVDSGFLELTVVCGSLAATLLFASILRALVAMWSVARRSVPTMTAYVAVMIGSFASMALGNALSGVNGVVFWLLLALCGKLAVAPSHPGSPPQAAAAE